MTGKKYTSLLAALAQFLTGCADPMTLQEFTDPDSLEGDKWITAAGLDRFLTDYAGQAWQAAKAGSRPGLTAAEALDLIERLAAAEAEIARLRGRKLCASII